MPQPQILSRAGVLSHVLRYGLGLLAFALPVLLSLLFRRYSIRFDLTLLSIAVLILTAWYAGTGPGIMVALLFELVSMSSRNLSQISWPSFLFTEFSRTALLVGLVLLVSSRKKASARLREQNELLRASEERFLKAFTASPVPMSIVTFDEGKYVDVNESFLLNSGYTREQIIGRTTNDIGIYAEPGERERLRRILQEQGSIRNLEVRRRVKSGEVRTALTSSELITIEGRRCVLTATNDITEHKQLEEQFRQSQKMEAVGRLAGGVAHDFNNLLTAIIGYSEIILSRLGKDDPMRRDLEEVERAGRRAAALTSQLLAFSRKQILQPRVLNLNESVADVSKMLQRLIGEDIELRTNLDQRLGSVKADPGQVEQIIMNLAVNARDAMPSGGKLTIESQNVSLDESYVSQHAEALTGPHVMLAISDTGLGMDRETQSHIFEPFFTTKEKGRGTGLGLATVYGIVKQSGGNIWVYSEPGRGTTFKLYFPRVDEVRESTAADEVESSGGAETILLVEDEEAVRKLARTSLEMKGYTVLEAANAAEGLGVSRAHRGVIHLLLTDVVMPGLSGKELAEVLLQSRPEMKVVYISGYTENAIVHHGVLDEGVAFLQKPFMPSALWERVRTALDSPGKR